ncbi:hypothetical protein [Flavobacterium sp.]|uniref:hypothetical protein n=1 Tax=Flavobacterium sp. TaxID=239 RepID=UPI0040474EF2
MTRTRIVGGKIIETTGGDYNIYTKENIVYSAGTTITETGVEKGVSYGEPDAAPIVNTNIDFDITFELDNSSKEIVPFGIANFENKAENPFFKFNYKLTGAAIDTLSFEILDSNGAAIYTMTYLKEIVIQAENKNKIQKELDSKTSSKEFKVYDFKETLLKYILEEPNYTKIGNYSIYWDGFDLNEIYDSTNFNGKKLKAKILVTKGSQRKQVEVEFETVYNEVNWVDVKIDKKAKRIDTTLRVNLKDGGANGLECTNTTIGADGLTITQCPWDDIPSSQISPSNPIIRTRTKSFQDLEKLALDGIEKHWSRNSLHNLKINNETFNLHIKAINTNENSMNELSLIFNTNSSWGRSGNPGILGKIYYNLGFCDVSSWYKFKKKWRYFNTIIDKVDEDYRYTSAHELGHTILRKYGGKWYSFTHDDSSSITQNPNGNQSYKKQKSNTEINLMHYFKDDPSQSQYDYNIIVASERDVLSLIWLTKIEIQ